MIKVPGAVLIPEVVALGLKCTWSLPTTAPRVAGPERVPDLLPDVRMLKISQQPQSQRSQGHSQAPHGLLSLVCL